MITSILRHVTDRYISTILIITIICHAILWFVWLGRTSESPLPVYFAAFVIILNFILSQFSYAREKLASYILTGFSFFIQLLMLVLLYNIISLQK